MPKLTAAYSEFILKETAAAFPHPACETCECFLGLVAQLRIDTPPEDRELFNAYKVERSQIHSCLGCAPCPPGERYAAYQQEKRNTPLIKL